MYRKLEIQLAGRPLSLETGRLAKQSHGAVLAQYGETVVLATVVSAYQSRDKIDFLPLTVDYVEKTFAAGKIPGGFFKREGRASEKEILTSRLIDRAMRPLFPKGYDKETQIIVNVLSIDKENDSDTLALIATSAALEVSDIPYEGPVAAVRMGRIDGKLVVNPLFSEMEQSDISLVIAAKPDSIVMLEGGAQVVDEEAILEALFAAHEEMRPVFELQQELRRLAGKPKREFTKKEYDLSLHSAVHERMSSDLERALKISGKKERNTAVYALQDKVAEELSTRFADRKHEIEEASEKVLRDQVRRVILDDDKRIDDRSSTEIRPLSAEIHVLPRTHGSAIFTRGETQVLATVTLGTSSDEQRVDALLGDRYKKFMLHYNFPPFSTGEVKFLRGPGRREIGHGALAERAMAAGLPPEEDFPYTIRLVSEVLESNGSSSMATVCGASLALMDAGVPLKAACAGIAMGLVIEGEKYAILTDIAGAEDHYGEMDIKVSGVSIAMMREALAQAKRARLEILDKMDATISAGRAEISTYAPHLFMLSIPTDKTRDLIGPGGKKIRGIIEATGVKIDVMDDGKVHVFASSGKGAEEALKMIRDVTATAEIGKTYLGTVVRIAEFGAFVEIFPGTDGLLHISEIAEARIRAVRDELKEGDQILVKVLAIEGNKIRLSRKAVLRDKQATTKTEAAT